MEPKGISHTLSDISDVEDIDGEVIIECATTIQKGMQVKEEHLDLDKYSEEKNLVLKRLIGLTLDDMVVGKVTITDKMSKNETVEIDAVVLFKTDPVMHMESTPKYVFRALAKAFEIRNFSNLGKARISRISYDLFWFTMIRVCNDSFYSRQGMNIRKNC